MKELMSFFVTEDGGLTTWGYVLFIALAVIALAVAVFFVRGKGEKQSSLSIKRLAFCSMSLALAFALSFAKIIPAPFGGSATLCSMLFVTLVGYWYGAKTGLLVAFVYSILQFLQGPYVLSPFQVCCDYLLAFTCLGLSGFFSNRKNGLLIGYIVSIVGRAIFHTLGGYLYWMDYMPEDFPAALSWAYPIIYNFSYILIEGIITVIIISIPAVKSAIAKVGKTARDN